MAATVEAISQLWSPHHGNCSSRFGQTIDADQETGTTGFGSGTAEDKTAADGQIWDGDASVVGHTSDAVGGVKAAASAKAFEGSAIAAQGGAELSSNVRFEDDGLPDGLLGRQRRGGTGSIAGAGLTGGGADNRKLHTGRGKEDGGRSKTTAVPGARSRSGVTSSRLASSD